MSRVAILSAASADLRRGVKFYSRERSGLGAEFLREFELFTDLLAENPEIGTPIGGGIRKLVLKRFPYLIIYRVESERVLILAVAHERRHPDYWLERL